MVRLFERLRWPFWNAEERRLRALVRLVVFGVGYVIVIGLCALSAQAIGPGPLALSFFFVAQALGVVVLTWLACRFVDRRPFRSIGLARRRGAALDLAFGTLLGLACIAGISIVERLVGLARYRTLSLDVLASRVDEVTMLVATFVGVAFVEEVVFRGYAMTNLAEGLRWTRLRPERATLVAVALSSLAFGLAHALNPNASPIAVANVAFGGVLLAAGYVVLGDLALSVGIHLGWNLAQALFDMPVSGQRLVPDGALVAREGGGAELVSGGAFGPEAGLTGLGAMVIGTLLVLLWARARVGRLQVHPGFGRPPSP